MKYWERGALRVSENRKYLKNGDTPFFWLGDTAWLLLQQSSGEDARIYLKNRVRIKDLLKRKPKEEKGKEELNSACFCGKSLFLIFVDNLLPVDPQVKLHYLFYSTVLTCK
mgnify:CR=1 FL=1